jgi:hypothetical protein
VGAVVSTVPTALFGPINVTTTFTLTVKNAAGDALGTVTQPVVVTVGP